MTIHTYLYESMAGTFKIERSGERAVARGSRTRISAATQPRSRRSTTWSAGTRFNRAAATLRGSTFPITWTSGIASDLGKQKHRKSAARGAALKAMRSLQTIASAARANLTDLTGRRVYEAKRDGFGRDLQPDGRASANDGCARTRCLSKCPKAMNASVT